ncbi:MAG: hypothetical protein KDC75_18555, partial [Phaeodactylibacter sp.]|nr:hypothetical protein [Phaeodactylibacter sp.]
LTKGRSKGACRRAKKFIFFSTAGLPQRIWKKQSTQNFFKKINLKQNKIRQKLFFWRFIQNKICL